MSENIGDLSLTVRVNKDTGELEVLKAQVSETGDSFKKLGVEAQGGGEQLEKLVGSMTKLASATAIIAFMKSAILEANQSAEAFRHLKSQMDAVGQSFDLNQERIHNWAEAMQGVAHLQDDLAINSLSKVIGKTKDLELSMKLVQLSQDIAISSGREFQSTLDGLTNAIARPERGLAQLQLQYGAQVSGAKNVGEAINMLARDYEGAASGAESLALKGTDITNSWDDLKKKIGSEVSPTLSFLSDQVITPLIAKLLSMEITIKTVATAAMAGIVAPFKVAAAALKGEFFDEIIRQSAIIEQVLIEGGKEQAALLKKNIATMKGDLATLGDMKVPPGQKETQALIEELDKRTEAIKASEQLQLSLADTTLTQQLANANKNGEENLQLTQANIARKMQILNQNAADEITLINETKSKVDDSELKSADRITVISQQLMLKQNKLRQEQTLAEKKAHDERAANFSSTLNTISTLATNKNKELAAIGKAAGIAQASIDTYAAANKALASAPPPFNFVLAAAVVAAGLVNVAKIASFAQGGVMTSGGPAPLKRYSNGGIANSPQLAEFGEGSGAEAYVPLPDGRRIPVKLNMSGGAGGGTGGGISVTVNMGGVVIQMGGIDPNNVDYFLSELSRRLGMETAQVVTLALQMKNLADRNERTAV